MRVIFVPAMLGIFACLGSSLAHAETAAVCLENALPMETLGNDAEQREAFLLQAKTCMREGKPLRAVALLSQIIKSDPTDAVAYFDLEIVVEAELPGIDEKDISLALQDGVLTIRGEKKPRA